MTTRSDTASRTTAHRLLTAGPGQAPLRPLVTPFAPLAFAYVGLDGRGPDERALRCRRAAERVRDAGAPDAAAAAVEQRLRAAVRGTAVTAVFVAPDGTPIHEERMRGAADRDDAGFRVPVPLVPLLRWMQDRPPFVLVVADRTGADLTACAGGGAAERTCHVTGPDDEIERNAPGGWAGLAQARYQNRAEDSWKHNADHVAEHVRRCAGEVGAQVLVTAGDVRALQYLGEALEGNGEQFVLRHLSGGRAADGSQQRRPGELEQALASAGDGQTRLLLEYFRSRLGRGDLAVEGVEPTVAALAAGRVATLLVGDPPLPHPGIWFGEGPGEIFESHTAAMRAGVAVESGDLVDAAVRSALLSGATVRVIDAGTRGAPASGIGAICRFGG